MVSVSDMAELTPWQTTLSVTVMFLTDETSSASVYLQYLKPWQGVGFKNAPITRMPPADQCAP